MICIILTNGRCETHICYHNVRLYEVDGCTFFTYPSTIRELTVDEKVREVFEKDIENWIHVGHLALVDDGHDGVVVEEMLSDKEILVEIHDIIETNKRFEDEAIECCKAMKKAQKNITKWAKNPEKLPETKNMTEYDLIALREYRVKQR